MRLSFVIYNLSSGGAQRIVANLANFWAEKGWRITILTYDDGRESPFYDLHPSVNHRPLTIMRRSQTFNLWDTIDPKRPWVLRKVIAESTPEVVISFIDRTNVLTLISTFGAGVPVIVTEMVSPAHFYIGKSWEILRRIVYPFAGALVVQTQGVLAYFSPGVRRRTKIIPNPVIRPPKADVDEQNRNASDSKTLIAMGRLCEQKGFDLLLSAFAEIAPSHPNWSLEIWGEGVSRSLLEQLRDRLGLQGRAQFPGVTNRPYEKMRQADLFVLSSRYEGMPNVLGEAMACGLPVVSFDCPTGPREIIRDGVDGILVPPEDVKALANALDRLIGDEGERHRLAMLAPEVTERFAVEKIIASWEELIFRVTQS